MHISAFGFSMWRKVGSWERLTIAPGPGSLVLRSVAIEPTSVVSKVTRLMRGLEELTWIGCMAVSSLMERLSSCMARISPIPRVLCDLDCCPEGARWPIALRCIGSNTHTADWPTSMLWYVSPFNLHLKTTFHNRTTKHACRNRSTLPTGYLLSLPKKTYPPVK